MDIFWRLLLAHLLADFTLQFNFVNAMKRKHAGGMLIHCFTHWIVSVALTWTVLDRTWFTLSGVAVSGWWALAVMFAVHFLIDELRIYSMSRLKFRDGTASFVIDQVLHVYVLLLISPLGPATGNFLMPEKGPVILSMLVMVTHVLTVLVYFLEKDFYGRNFPGADEQYFLIFERLVLWGFFFVEGRWWMLFAAAWAVQMFYVKKKRIMDISMLNVVLSIAVTSALGVLTRRIYYGAF